MGVGSEFVIIGVLVMQQGPSYSFRMLALMWKRDAFTHVNPFHTYVIFDMSAGSVKYLFAYRAVPTCRSLLTGVRFYVSSKIRRRAWFLTAFD